MLASSMTTRSKVDSAIAGSMQVCTAVVRTTKLCDTQSRVRVLICDPTSLIAFWSKARFSAFCSLRCCCRRSCNCFLNSRGLEMAKHKEFTVATNVQVYFCDPQSPWQRGTNENTNLLLRQYFPRGTDLSPITQAQLDQVSLRLNQRPRKTLGFQTPASKLQASVASTV